MIVTKENISGVAGDPMGEKIRENVITFRLNRIELYGDLCVPEGAQILVLLLLGEREDHFLERFSKLKQILNSNRIATCLVRGLLTRDERQISANRSDETLLADRLIAVTKQLRTYSNVKDLKLAYVSLSSVGGSMFRASSSLKDEIESLVLIGNGLPPLNLVFSQVPILNIIGALDFKGLESNKINLSKIDAPIKRFHLIQGSPSHFEERQKWSLVSDAILNWFSHPENRSHDFAE